MEQEDTVASAAPGQTFPARSRWPIPLWATNVWHTIQQHVDRFQRWLFQLGGRALAAALAILILGIASNALVAYVSIHAISDRDAWVAHTQVVLAQIAEVQADLLDAQTGARGYVITGDESFLRPYTTAAASVNADLRTLQGLTLDNPTQLARIATLKAQIPVELDGVAGVDRPARRWQDR